MTRKNQPIPQAHKRAVGALLPLAERRAAAHELYAAYLAGAPEEAAQAPTDTETPEVEK